MYKMQYQRKQLYCLKKRQQLEWNTNKDTVENKSKRKQHMLEILKETMNNEAWITYETLSLSVYLCPISLWGLTCKYDAVYDKPLLSLHQSNNENSIDG